MSSGGLIVSSGTSIASNSELRLWRSRTESAKNEDLFRTRLSRLTAGGPKYIEKWLAVHYRFADLWGKVRIPSAGLNFAQIHGGLQVLQIIRASRTFHVRSCLSSLRRHVYLHIPENEVNELRVHCLQLKDVFYHRTCKSIV